MKNTVWTSVNDKAFTVNTAVHIWKIFYPDFSLNNKELLNVLNTNEIKRAQKFHFKIDRKRYIVTKALLKIILGRILKVAPMDLKFIFNDHGKPALAKNIPLYFNISHSADIGLIAISDLGPVGVDVERYRQKMANDKIAKRFFSATEVDTFIRLPDNQKLKGFFNCWTRKEAIIKALGLGLAMPLRNFDVSLRPGKTAQLLDLNYMDENAGDWTLEDIPMENDYAAAFAIKAENFKDFFWNAKDLV